MDRWYFIVRVAVDTLGAVFPRTNIVTPELSHPTQDELQTLEQWYSEGRRLALATVIATWGSSPRPVGSHCVIDSEGRFEGSVSGGCIEGAVITEALEIIEQQGEGRRLHFSVADDNAWSVGLSCGGSIELWVQQVDDVLVEQIAQINQALLTRQSRYLSLSLSDQPAELWCRDTVPVPLQAHIDRLSASQQSVLLDDRSFVRSYVPAYRLMIVGAVHIAQRLIPMAQAAGYDVYLIDPRRTFATASRFPSVPISYDWPDEFFERNPLDSQTAVVTLTHDPKIDDPALAFALQQPCFYIGALGSSRTHAKRLERLHEQGLAGQSGRIHGPVGIKLGGRTPEAIAVSILAELTQQRFADKVES